MNMLNPPDVVGTVVPSVFGHMFLSVKGTSGVWRVQVLRNQILSSQALDVPNFYGKKHGGVLAKNT